MVGTWWTCSEGWRLGSSAPPNPDSGYQSHAFGRYNSFFFFGGGWHAIYEECHMEGGLLPNSKVVHDRVLCYVIGYYDLTKSMTGQIISGNCELSTVSQVYLIQNFLNIWILSWTLWITKSREVLRSIFKLHRHLPYLNMLWDFISKYFP